MARLDIASAARRRRSTVLLLGAGLVALVPLLPLLASPIQADSTYNYFIPETRHGNDLIGVVTYAWRDVPNTAAYGRIAPVSWSFQHLQYWAGLRTAVVASLPLEIVNGLTRLILLALTVAALYAYLRRVRAPGPDPLPLPRPLVQLVVATAMLVFAAGARLDSPFRNSLTSYPAFTIAAAVLVFAVPALALGVMSRQLRRARGEPWLGLLLLIVAGAALALSYELWYIAGGSTLLAILLQPLPHAQRWLRWRALAAFGVPFVLGVIAVRLAIRALVEAQYAGVSMRLGMRMVRTFVLNIINSLPGGDPNRLAERAGLPPAQGWQPGWAALAVAGCLVLALLTRYARASALGPPRRDARLIAGWGIRVAGVLIPTALAAALIMALSVQAQERIFLGRPFRNYVITWGCFATLVGVGLVALVATRRFWWPAVGLLAVSAFLVVVGPVQADRMATWTRAEHTVWPGREIQRVHSLFTRPELDPAAERERCAALDGLGRSNGYPVGFLRQFVQPAFERFYGVPYCTNPKFRPRYEWNQRAVTSDQ